MNIELPPIKLISLKNEVDRFGFSYVLSKFFGLKQTPRAFAAYAHGWTWVKEWIVEDMGHYFTPRNIPIIVATEFHKKALIKFGFSNVTAGGLPFAYIPKSNTNRKLKSLLVMPPHSMELWGGNIETFDSIIKFIKSIDKDFTEISFCLHVDDSNDKIITNKLLENGINFIVGANPMDANSLYRIRIIFDYFDYVTTTIMGSHVLYSAFCGCKVSILREYIYKYEIKVVENNHYLKKIPNHMEIWKENYGSTAKLIDDYPWLFVSHPKEAIEMTDWANKEIGIDNLLAKEKLMELLGWTFKSKIKSIIRIVYNKVAFLRRSTFG